MQISKMKVGRWYQTKYGIGTCIAVSKTAARFNGIPDSPWLSGKDVEYEIPAGDEPDADEGAPPTMLDVLETVKKHIDELADAWSRGALVDRDGQGGARSNRNADVQRLLEKVINNEKGSP